MLNKTATIEFMKKQGIQPKKSIGQNFLTDAFVVDKILAAAELSSADFVIEIGPGLGALTADIAKKAGKLTAIELDTRLIPILQESLGGFSNFDIINADVLKVDIGAIIENSGYSCAKIIANLPYYITTPIIFHILEKGLAAECLVLMMQKEVASRIMAKPGTKDYGLLTLSVAYYSECHLIANVPPNAFLPRPDVQSAVVKLLPLPPRQIDRDIFFKITKAAFSNRRKTLENCLSTGLSLPKEQARELIAKSELRPDIRGEALNFAQFENLACNYLRLVL